MMKSYTVKRILASCMTLAMLLQMAPAVPAYADEGGSEEIVQEETVPEQDQEQQETEPAGEETNPTGEEQQETEPAGEETNPTGEEQQETPMLLDAGQDDSEGDISAQSEENDDSFTLKVNGLSAAMGQNLTVVYGQPLAFTLDGYTGSNSVTYKYAVPVSGEDPDNWNWQKISDGYCRLEPGVTYRLSYGVNARNSEGTDTWKEDNSFSVTVTKGTVAAPANLAWNGSVMSWDAVTATSYGCALDDGTVTGYTVTVYKNGTAVRTFTTGANATSYLNFANNLLDKNDSLGAGSYTFTVQAMINAGTHYETSNVSGTSSEYVVPSITVIAGTGIESVTPTESFILLPGNADHNTQEITYVEKEGYTFSGWTADAGLSAADGKVTVSSTYSGSTAPTVTANAADTNAPAVSAPVKGDGYTVTASAEDNETGVAAYAFSASETAEGVAASEWTEISTPAAGSVRAVFTPAASGVYYFYAKDTNGNTAKSTAISVTRIELVRYNYQDEPADITVYKIGDETWSLPVPSCDGYVFTGWYENSELSGAPVTQPSHNTAGTLTYYARWETETLTIPAISVSGNGITKTGENEYTAVYDGNGITLSVNIRSSGELSYQWSRDGAAIAGATDSSYTVRDVNAGGKYTLSVTLKDRKGNVIREGTSEAWVTVTPRAVTVIPGKCTLSYGADAPAEYSYTCSPEVLEGDTLTDDTHPGTVTCEYVKGSPVGKYTITASGFDANSNYDVKYETGTLTVSPKSADEADITASFAEALSEYTYTGEEIRPEVIVKDGDTVISSDNYTVEYFDNTEVGSAKAVITFNKTGSYSGEITLEFSVIKADLSASVSLEGWTYGDAANTPVVTGNAGNAAVTFEYKEKDGELWTNDSDEEFGGSAVVPTDAGTYEVIAKISGTNSYNPYITNAFEFTISKRTITLSSGSVTAPYDGKAHSNSETPSQEGSFAYAGEGFVSVSATGSRTAVGMSDNTIEYTLNDSTKSSNYSIVCCPGTIEVTAVKLTSPSNAQWDSTAPGKAEWIAVSKEGLTAQYSVQLYAKTADGSFTAIGEPVIVDSTSCDLSGLIRADAETRTTEDTAASYSFTVTTLAAGETAENFKASDESGKNGNLYTARITVNAALENPEENSHVSAVEIHRDGQDSHERAASDTVVLLQGEIGRISATCDKGYQLQYGWTVRNAGSNEIETAFTSVYTDGLSASLCNVQLYPNTEDNDPWIASFSVENAAYDPDHPESSGCVRVTFTAKDDVGLYGWMLIQSAETSLPASDSRWNKFTSADGSAVTEYTVTYNVRGSGSWYLYLIDTAGNLVYRSQSVQVPVTYKDGTKGFITEEHIYPFEVNAITLEPGSAVTENGDTVNAEGTSVTLYKLANTAVTLPSLTDLGFSMEGYAFRNWFGTTGIYEINGKYSENKDDTLTANWTNEYHDYTVNYYYMNTDGTYSEVPDDTADYNVIYGTEITVSTPAIQRPKDGFSLDTAKDAKITVKGDGMSISVFYYRNTHTLTRQYTIPGETEVTEEKYEILYGADLSTALTVPSQAGYTFVGWDFGAAKAENTMPDNDVTVTGEFVADQQTVHIRYFEQDLNGTGYTMVSEMNREVKADTDGVIIESAEEIEGFAYSSSCLTYGAQAAELPDDAGETLPTCAVDGKGSDIYLNLFYVRRLYTVTLKVWQGKVGEGSAAYTMTWKDIPYGTDMTSGDYSAQKMADYAEEQLEAGTWTAEDGTVLADYVDWSTGTAPETMPAGDVTITRQFVSDQDGEYQVEIWVEGAASNTYEKHSFTYYGKTGALVDITGEVSSLSSLIEYNQYYHVRTVAVVNGGLTYTDDVYDSNGYALGDEQGSAVSGDGLTEGTQLTGHVTDTVNGEEKMVLRFFMERNRTSSTITYRYNDGTMTSSVVFAQVTKRVKWGHSYDYEPLAFFGSSVTWSAESENLGAYSVSSTEKISDPVSYDFLNNYYIVSYSGYYVNYNTEHWPNKTVNSVETLNAIRTNGCASLSTSYIMGQTSNRMTVTYSKPTALQYCLNVVYTGSGLSGSTDRLAANKNSSTPTAVTYDYDGKTYKVRYANEAFFYTDAEYIPGSTEKYKDYPGLSLYNLKDSDSTGRFVYSVFDSENYQKVQIVTKIGTKSYYISLNDDYIYIPVSDNRLFNGNYTSCPYDVNNEIGHEAISDFMEAYRNLNADSSKCQSIYVYNHSWGSTWGYTQTDRACIGNVTITFREYDPRYIYYYVNGTTCTGHAYTYGTTVTEFDCTEHGLPTKEGYTIEWYTDSKFTTRVTSLKMTENHTLYGKFVKETYPCHEYAYYELAGQVTVGETVYSYITENDLSTFAGDPLFSSSANADGTVTTYYYDGNVVMIDTAVSVESFSDFAMDRTESRYIRTGLTYDAANPANSLNGYVETEAIALHAYFKRDTYTLTIDYSDPKANDETVTLRYGQSYTLEDPERGGYTFSGWTAEAADGSAIELTEGKTFVCPQQNVAVKASWTAASLGEQNIIHYYQNSSLGFDTELVSAAMKEEGSAVTLTLPDGTEVAGRQYTNGAVSYTAADGNVYYYSSASDGKLNVENLSAVVCTRELTQDTEETVSAGEISQGEYNFAYVLLKTEDSIEKYDAGTDTYKDTYGMTLEYYYTLEEGYSITLKEYITVQDSTEPGTVSTTPLSTLNGAGENYYYSQNVQVSASLPAGYTFKGWYTAKANGAPDTLFSENLICTRNVKEDTVLVAWIEASKVSQPSLTLSGPKTLTYGYSESKENAITVKAEFPEDAGTANYVYSYQWYEVTDEGETPISENEGGTSATYLIATGKECGTYSYRCKVVIARKDNGLTQEFTTDDYSFTITAGSLTAACTGYSAIYDGAEHSISVSVAEKTDYTIYYAVATDELTELTADNYTKYGTTEKPMFTDVCDVTVLYYVQADNSNYTDAAGSGTVVITAKQLTLNAGSTVFSKVYDGAAAVSGNATDASTDLGRLAQDKNIYTLVGLAGSDTATTDIISCTAEFNSSHTASANVLTLSGISLIHADGTVNENYYFDSGYEISISGYITAMPLELEWSNDVLTYNGSTQGPSAVITTAVPDSDKGSVSVRVGGSQTNIGTYPASAVLVIAENSSSEATDFSLEGGSHQFTINQKDITISPAAESFVYDGTAHTLSSFEVTEGALADGQILVSAIASDSRTDAGTTVITAGSAVIKEYTVDPATGEKTYNATTTNNYNISYGTAELTVEKRPVTVSGLTGEDKVYDGTADAAANVSGAVFGPAAGNADSGLVKGDSLSIDPAEASAAFDNANAGKDKTVTFTLGENALTGASADNYVLDLSGSTLTTTNSITQKQVTVTADDTDTVYGENAGFGFTYTAEDFIEADRAKIDELVSGSVTYTIVKQGAEAGAAAAYDVTTDAGIYDIYVSADGSDPLTAENYCFVFEKGTLTVAQRPVAVQGTAGSAVNKTYDGTTAATAENKEALTGMYEFTAVSGNSASGLVNGDTVTLIDGSFNDSSYNNKNVDGSSKATQVTVSGLTSDDLSDSNYVLANDSFTVGGSISPKAVTISAENKEVTYGNTEDVNYTAEAEGLAAGDTLENAFTGLTFNCDYDPDTFGSREVRAGGYTITVDENCTAVNGNYTITLKSGTLTVKPAVITVITELSSVTAVYSESSVPEVTFSANGMQYGENFADVVKVSGTAVTLESIEYTVPSLTDASGRVITASGAQHFATAEKTVGAGTKTVISTLPGKYTVQPVITGFTADNYTITFTGKDLQIDKFNLKIDGIKVSSRVYDGTTDVYQSQFDFSEARADGLLSSDQSAFDTGKTGMFGDVTATYNSADVAPDNEITITNINFGQYLSDRFYVASNCQTVITAAQGAAITPRPLQVTADDKSVLYGETTGYTVTYGKTYAEASGFVTGESAGSDSVTITCVYAAGDDTGTYTITPSAFTGSSSAKAGNYTVTYKDGTLTVKQNQLKAPTVSWVEGTPGTVTWTKVSGIGNVAVAGYTAVLYKDGTAVTGGRATTDADTNTCDFSDLIHASGAGVYTVKVTAEASEENNANNKNVLDSKEGVSGGLYAAEVSFVFADDTTTQAGKSTEAHAISVTGKDNETGYDGDAHTTVIAGESDIAIAAVFRNATGYTIKSVSSDSSMLTVEGETSTETAAGSYNSTVAMSGELNSTEDITVTIALSPVKAELSVNVAATPNEVTYGYTGTGVPVLSVSAAPGDTRTGYTYTYQWQLYFAGEAREEDAYKAEHTGSSEAGSAGTDTWNLPTGLKANDNAKYYRVHCVVTAVRDDNGESITSADTWSVNDSSVALLKIDRADCTGEISMSGWTYGDARQTPSTITCNVTDNEMVNDAAHTHYYYKLKSAEDVEASWTSVFPTDAGEYQVKAVVDRSQNYGSFATNIVDFTIAKAQLDTPEELTMQASETAPYGLISWDAVTGFTGTTAENLRENAGADDSKSAIEVTYLVELYKQGENGEYSVCKTYTTDKTSLNITSDLQVTGKYYYTVTAKSSNTSDCEDSEVSEHYPIFMDGKITAQDTATDKEAAVVSEISKKYDGYAIILTAVVDNAETYQWYNGTEAIAGADKQTYNVTDVTESGSYTCMVTAGNTVYTPKVQVTISRREVTLTSADDSKVYDGTALTNGTVTVSVDCFAAGEGATYSVTGSITDVSENAEKNNSFTYALNDNTKADNYSITVVPGTLSITARTINKSTEFSYEEISEVLYNGSAHTPTPSVTDKGLATEDTVLTADDISYSYSNNVDAGTATVTITGKGNYTGSVTFDFTIAKRNVTLTSETKSKVYDGTALTDGTVTVSDDGFAAGEGATYNVTGSITDVSENAEKNNSFTYTLNSNTKADNYNITVVPGTLSITPITTPIIITADSDSKMYDGTALTKPTCTYTQGILISGDDLTAKVEGTITDHGTADNIVISYEVTRDGTDVTANYTFGEPVKGTLTITQRNVTLTSATQTKVYDGTALTNGTVTVGGRGFAAGEGASYSVTGTITAVGSTSNTFTYTLNSGTKAENYNITMVPGTLNITEYAEKITVTVHGGTYTYDGQPHQATVEVSTLPEGYTLEKASSNAVLTHAYEDSVTAKCDTLIIRNAQGVDVTAKLNISYVTDTLTISQKELYVVTESKSMVYNGSTLTAGGTATGFVEGETAEFTVTGKQTAAGSSRNTYSIKWNGTAKSGDYNIIEDIGMLVVTETATTITVTTTGGTFEYDGETHRATVAVSELPEGYTVETAISSAQATHVADGTVSAVCDTLVIRNAQGVDVTEALKNNIVYVNDTIKITPAVLTVVTDSDGKIYDGTALTAGGNISGYKHGETATFTVTGSREAVGSSRNTYTLVFDKSAAASDYTVSENIGTLTVNEYNGEITVTASGDFTYDGTAHDALVEVSTLPTGYTLITATSDAQATHVAETPAAAHCDTLVIKNADGDDVTDKLNIRYVDETLVIKPAVLTVITPDAEKVYNGTELTAAGTITGFIGDETAAFSTTGTQTAAGESDNTYSLTFNGTAAESDYTIAETIGKLTVTEYAGEITVTTIGGTYTYDKQTHEGSVEVSELPEGYTLAGAETESKATHVAEGKVTVTVSELSIINAQGVDVTDKLNITVKEEGILEITPAVLTVVTESGHKVYDGRELTAKGTITGFVADDSGELVTTGSQKNAGSSRNTYTIKWAENTAASDYTTAETLGTLTVTRADVTVTADNASKVYGTKDPAWTAQITGTVTDDDKALILYSISRNAGENAGTYTLTTSGEAEQGNYNVTFVGAVFTIEKAPVTISTKDRTYTYNAAPHGYAAVSDTDEVTILYSTDGGKTWTEDVPSVTNVGKMTVMVKTDSPNYVTATGEYTVTVIPAEVTVVADTKSSTEGSPLKDLTYTVNGKVYGSDSLGSIALTTDATETAGSYTIRVNVTDANPNYTVTTVNGVYTVTAAGEKTPIVVPDGSIGADVPDEEDTKDKVLTDEDKEAEENGEDVQIRVVVDDQNPETRPEDIQEDIDEALKPDDETKDVTTEVVKVIDIDIEKKVGDSDWESVGNPDGTVQVEISVPEIPEDRNGHYAIVKIGDGTVTPMDNLSENPGSIVIETDDFDSEYALVFIEDEEAPLANMSGVPCYWHWLQILLVLLSVIYLILVKKSKLRALGMAADVILAIITELLGFCRFDVWFFIGNLVILLLTAYLTRKKKSDAEPKEEEAKA